MEETSKKLKIPYPIIVEGKYDRLRLINVCDAHIITTDGFGIFKSAEKLAIIRQLCKKTPVILLTDSDGAGKVIRSHITSAIPADRLIQIYIPQIKGTEKRKAHPSAEGTLGVEGMDTLLLYELLSPFQSEDNTLQNRSLYRRSAWSVKQLSKKRRACYTSGTSQGNDAKRIIGGFEDTCQL